MLRVFSNWCYKYSYYFIVIFHSISTILRIKSKKVIIVWNQYQYHLRWRPPFILTTPPHWRPRIPTTPPYCNALLRYLYHTTIDWEHIIALLHTHIAVMKIFQIHDLYNDVSYILLRQFRPCKYNLICI